MRLLIFLFVICSFQSCRQQFQTRLHMMAKVYGTAAPMNLLLESKILSQFQRGGGLPSSHIGLENLLGLEDEITAADYMTTRQSETIVQPFEEMERRLGDKPIGKFL